MTCKQIEPLLASFVDGTAEAGDCGLVDAHLTGCGACRQVVAAQRAVRTVLQSRAAYLSPVAPPGLRTRLAATAHEGQPQHSAILGWRGRLSAFAAAALLVILVGAAATPFLTSYSSVVLAAQLALDHVKCFMIDGDAHASPISAAQAEATLKSEYGYSFAVPQLPDGSGLNLVAVRRCLYGDGFAAHLLYRLDGAPVSLFVMPGVERPSDEMAVLGHDQLIWNDGHTTFMLVGRTGNRARLEHVASQLRNEAK